MAHYMQSRFMAPSIAATSCSLSLHDLHAAMVLGSSAIRSCASRVASSYSCCCCAHGQVLLANCAMLVPEYKRQCKREWGIEGKPFDVSFFAAIDYCPQRPDPPAFCSNGECMRHCGAECDFKGCTDCASLSWCSRCQVWHLPRGRADSVRWHARA